MTRASELSPCNRRQAIPFAGVVDMANHDMAERVESVRANAFELARDSDAIGAFLT